MRSFVVDLDGIKFLVEAENRDVAVEGARNIAVALGKMFQYIEALTPTIIPNVYEEVSKMDKLKVIRAVYLDTFLPSIMVLIPLRVFGEPVVNDENLQGLLEKLENKFPGAQEYEVGAGYVSVKYGDHRIIVDPETGKVLRKIPVTE